MLQSSKLSLDPYLRKAIQNLIRIHDPEYLRTANVTTGNEQGTIREFWVSFYGIAAIRRHVSGVEMFGSY